MRILDDWCRWKRLGLQIQRGKKTLESLPMLFEIPTNYDYESTLQLSKSENDPEAPFLYSWMSRHDGDDTDIPVYSQPKKTDHDSLEDHYDENPMLKIICVRSNISSKKSIPLFTPPSDSDQEADADEEVENTQQGADGELEQDEGEGNDEMVNDTHGKQSTSQSSINHEDRPASGHKRTLVSVSGNVLVCRGMKLIRQAENPVIAKKRQRKSCAATAK